MTTINKQFLRLVAVSSISFTLLACKPNSESEQAPPPAMPPMPVTVLNASATTVPISTETVGQTEGAKAVEVRPRVGGILLKKHFTEGAEIKKGQPMFTIDPVPYQMEVQKTRAQLVHQKARVSQADRESERLKQLLASQSISQREYDNSVSDSAMASADLTAAEVAVHQAELNLSYSKVAAPSSGIAERFLLSEGALVSANTTLLTTIIKTSPIWVRFSLSDHDLSQLGGMLNKDAINNISLVLPDGSVYPESGKLNFHASEIDPALGTQLLRATFKNKDKRLVPGQFVRVRINTGNRNNVYLVPQTAVLTGDHGKFVWLATQNAEGKTAATPAPIEVAGWQGQDWVVTSGLKGGDQVIVDNLIKIRPGAPVQAKQPETAQPVTQEE